MTTAIAQFMREPERVWDEHRNASIVRRDLAASMAHLATEPSVCHLPAMTGAAGRRALERFYAEDFLPTYPVTWPSPGCRGPWTASTWWMR